MGVAFEVEIPEATKNGDIVKYKLVVDGKQEVHRVYDDFSWLLHCLKTDTRSQGIIYPPIPKSPAVDAKEAEKRAREQYGSESNVLPSDAFSSECRQMERFMKLLIEHPILGESTILRDFLTNEEAPQSVQMKTSRVLKWSSSVSEKIKAGHKDVSPYFEDERNKTSNALSVFKGCRDDTESVAVGSIFSVDDEHLSFKLRPRKRPHQTSFSRMVTNNNRLAIAYSDLAHSSLPEEAIRVEDSTVFKRFGAIFSKIYTDLQHVEQTLGEDEARTLGRFFNFYTAYYNSLKESLYKRTCLLISFQDAAKALEKAKADKKATAEVQKTEKEKEFDDFSHELKEEIVRFHRERVELTHKAIVNFARAQIKAAVDRHALVTKEINLLNNLPM